MSPGAPSSELDRTEPRHLQGFLNTRARVYLSVYPKRGVAFLALVGAPTELAREAGQERDKDRPRALWQLTDRLEVVAALHSELSLSSTAGSKLPDPAVSDVIHFVPHRVLLHECEVGQRTR